VNVEKLVEQMNDGRLINATEGLFVPMFKQHCEDLIAKLCIEFRAGGTNFLPLVAQLSYIRDLVDELERKKTKGNAAYKKLNQGDN